MSTLDEEPVTVPHSPAPLIEEPVIPHVSAKDKVLSQIHVFRK